MPDPIKLQTYASMGYLEGDEVKEKLAQLETLKAEYTRRRIQLEPMAYGAPDILFPRGMAPGRFDRDTGLIHRDPLDYEETQEQYEQRQNDAMYDLVTKYLFIVKDDKVINILLIPKMAKILADLFFGRIEKLILWGPRGGGKSLLAAVFMWIAFVYTKRSCLNMGGAGNQARRVYDYTKQFWHSFPGMMKSMLTREPLLQSSTMRNGSQLTCATSVTTAIGEHVGIFVADEACTDRAGADHDLLRAMQGAMSEENHRIFLLSTFHLPTGFFADTWDNAETLGFTRMTFDCFDIMEQCDAGLELATEDDPFAVESFCKKECPLSWQQNTTDEFGNVTGQEWVGCLGKARQSKGWHTREQVLDEQRINIGTRIFQVEHACIRPKSEGMIYNPDLINACITPYVSVLLDQSFVVGIDWGLTECAIVLVAPWEEGTLGMPDFNWGIAVIDVVYMSNRLTQAVIDQVGRWQERYGSAKYQMHGENDGIRVKIRADGSHPYCNREVADSGYRVKPVHGDRKQMGEDNLKRWIASGRFKICDGFSLFVTQLHNLRRNPNTGKQKKENKPGEEGDHGPDALKFACLEFDYVKMYRHYEQLLEEHEKAQRAPKRQLPKARRGRRSGLDGLIA